MAPFAAIFVDPDDPENAMYNNFRVYGTILLYFMGMTYSEFIKKTNIFKCHSFNFYSYASDESNTESKHGTWNEKKKRHFHMNDNCGSRK